MEKLVSDRAKSETSEKVLDILRAYAIDDWQSEPHLQHQNPAEQRYQTIKNYTNAILEQTGAPAYNLHLCITYVCALLSLMFCDAIRGQILLMALTGQTTDISLWL